MVVAVEVVAVVVLDGHSETRSRLRDRLQQRASALTVEALSASHNRGEARDADADGGGSETSGEERRGDSGAAPRRDRKCRRVLREITARPPRVAARGQFTHQ